MLKVKSILIKGGTFILFCLLSFNSIAQNTNTIFKGSTPFKLSINNTLQHPNYTKNINVQLYGEQYYNVKIEFENDTTLLKKNIYIIDNGLAYFFDVTLSDFTLKKITPNQLLTPEKGQLTLTYTGKEMPVASLPIDTITPEDTNYIPPFDSYYELEGYTGIITCPWPIKAEVLAEFKGIIKSELIDDSKFEKIKERVLDSDSLCITVEQVAELIPLFQYEDTKLVFAKFILPHIFDVDNVGKLEKAFQFENSVEELKEHLEDIKKSK